MTEVATLRLVGKQWERNFCKLAGRYGKEFTPHQLPLANQAACSYWQDTGGWHVQLLPDVAIWSGPGEHHEIKHKNRMTNGCYGYEEYRLRELVRFADTTGQRVYMTIHDWERAGASSATAEMPNRIEDWVYADVADLAASRSGQFTGPSLVAGIRKLDVRQFRWNAAEYFRPLASLWASA